MEDEQDERKLIQNSFRISKIMPEPLHLIESKIFIVIQWNGEYRIHQQLNNNFEPQVKLKWINEHWTPALQSSPLSTVIVINSQLMMINSKIIIMHFMQNYSLHWRGQKLRCAGKAIVVVVLIFNRRNDYNDVVN